MAKEFLYFGRLSCVSVLSSSEYVLRAVEQRLYDDVLLHHVEGEVLLRLQDGAGVLGGGRPHEGGAEDDGQVGDLHAVVLLLLDDAQQVAQEGGQGGAVGGGHGRQHVLQRLRLRLEGKGEKLLDIHVYLMNDTTTGDF